MNILSRTNYAHNKPGILLLTTIFVCRAKESESDQKHIYAPQTSIMLL
jgi:hypothetical protein